MTKRLLSLAVVAISIVGLTSVAMANVPDNTNSTAASGSGCFRITPDGSGMTLASQGLTVTVTVRDASNDPIPAYPAADVTLGDDVNGVEVSLCNGGVAADANTNAAGVTTISGVVAGGGNNVGMAVRVAGVMLAPASNLAITAVSSDYDGSLAVDAVDLGLFPGGFADLFLNAGYDVFADLNCSGVENLADVGIFATDFLGAAACQ